MYVYFKLIKGERQLMKDASRFKKQMFISILTLGSLISSMLLRYWAPNYTAQVIVSSIMVLSAIANYHHTNPYQKGKELLLNRLVTAGFIFMGVRNIIEPYIGPVGSFVLISIALIINIPYICNEVNVIKRTLNGNDNEE